MAIRAAVRSDLKPLDGLEAFFKNINKAAEQIMGEVADKRGKRLLKPMHNLNPGKSKHGARRGAWSTNPARDTKARKWWFANFKNEPYRRTGKTNKAWVLVARKTGRRTSLALENVATDKDGKPIAKFIYSFAKNPKPRGGRPNPGHIRTGWPKKTRKVGLAVLEDARELVEDAFAETVAATVSTGKFKVVVP